MKNRMAHVFPGNLSSPGSVIALPKLPPLHPTPRVRVSQAAATATWDLPIHRAMPEYVRWLMRDRRQVSGQSGK